MTEILIWVVTVPVAAFFGWTVYKWPKAALRITSAALFGIVWIGALQFANMDMVWKLVMPVVMVVAMAFFLVKRTHLFDRGTA